MAERPLPGERTDRVENILATCPFGSVRQGSAIGAGYCSSAAGEET
jgi:hypothetical protein